jgi:hypothetical protein
MENFNDVVQNSIDNDTAVIVYVDSLREINEQAVERGYNRALDWELAEAELHKFFNELNDSVEHQLDIEKMMLWFPIVLVPLMEHQHKRGVPCEKHMRCLVNFGKTPHPILDVPMSTWGLMCKHRNQTQAMEREHNIKIREATLCCDFKGSYQIPTTHDVAA